MQGFPTDFVVSYVPQDKEWAEWIAWVISHHFNAVAIKNALSSNPSVLEEVWSGSKRVVPVLSPASINSKEAEEWQNLCVTFPEGKNSMGGVILIPILVKRFEVPYPLGSLPSIDLTSFSTADEDTAARLLFQNIQAFAEPPFPGA